jgi:hypothetical protein
MQLNQVILQNIVLSVTITTLSLIPNFKVEALSDMKTIKMVHNRTYHCHEKGSEKIQDGRSTFKCELMKLEKGNNPYNYVTTNKIINLYCLGKLSGKIEYDEGNIYKYLMTCNKK